MSILNQSFEICRLNQLIETSKKLNDSLIKSIEKFTAREIKLYDDLTEASNIILKLSNIINDLHKQIPNYNLIKYIEEKIEVTKYQIHYIQKLNEIKVKPQQSY